MQELGPISVIYNYQSIILAVVVSFSVTIIKRTIDTIIGGRENRKSKPWLDGVILPIIPVVLGASIANISALEPNVLVTHVQFLQLKHLYVRPWLVFGTWGAAVGTLSEWIFNRVKTVLNALPEKLLLSVKLKRTSNPLGEE